jgi:hypothetical protein
LATHLLLFFAILTVSSCIEWRFDCGKGLGTPTTAYLHVNVTGPGIEFTKYHLDFQNLWNAQSPGIVESTFMDNLLVHTEYMLMFKHTYNNSQIYSTKHTATILVDEEVFPHGYELTGQTDIDIVDDKTCHNAVRSAVPSLSPMPAALSRNSASTSAATPKSLDLACTLGGTAIAAVAVQMFLL